MTTHKKLIHKCIICREPIQDYYKNWRNMTCSKHCANVFTYVYRYITQHLRYEERKDNRLICSKCGSDKRKRQLKKRVDYFKAIINYYSEYYKSSNIFQLQQEMLEKGICPRCGTISFRWSSREGHFPCWECWFNITPLEIKKVVDTTKNNKYILKKRLRQKAKKENRP